MVIESKIEFFVLFFFFIFFLCNVCGTTFINTRLGHPWLLIVRWLRHDVKPETVKPHVCLYTMFFYHYLLPVMKTKKCKGKIGMIMVQATRSKERRCAQVMVMVNDKEKESVKVNMRKQGKVCDVTEQARKPVRKEMHLHDAVPLSPPPRHVRLPKPVDEDLYKIPPELLRTTKRVSYLTSPHLISRVLLIYSFIINILLVCIPNTIHIVACAEENAGFHFQVSGSCGLRFMRLQHLVYSEDMLGWFLLLPDANITV